MQLTSKIFGGEHSLTTERLDEWNQVRRIGLGSAREREGEKERKKGRKTESE
jgi:hypothetical protein